ncbi:MAG: HAD-IA family hydrolase, partial [Betaproteobacteria bacterium]
MPTPPPTIRAVVFDAYGTLLNTQSVVENCEALFPGKGSALSQMWRSKQLEYSWLRSLMERYVDFNQVTRESLQFTCKSLGLAFSDLALARLNDAYR